jgi:hypothetical protein
MPSRGFCCVTLAPHGRLCVCRASHKLSPRPSRDDVYCSDCEKVPTGSPQIPRVCAPRLGAGDALALLGARAVGTQPERKRPNLWPAMDRALWSPEAVRLSADGVRRKVG